jgi:hypothetical protein
MSNCEIVEVHALICAVILMERPGGRRRHRTENQGGQKLNMYFHYRYDAGIATGDIFNYEDLRAEVLEFMGDVDASKNPYWATLNEELCTELVSVYPIRAISCLLQV